MKLRLLPAAISLLLCSMAALAAEMATAIHDSAVYEKPYRDSAVVMEILANSSLLAEGRRGGWYRVTVAGRSGWIRMTALRFGRPVATGDDGAIGAIQLLTTGRSGYSGVTAGTGIRGLNPSDMLNAVPDPAALEKLSSFRSSPEAARQFAQSGGLSATDLDYLKNSGAPPPPTTDEKPGSFDPFQGLGGN